MVDGNRPVGAVNVDQGSAAGSIDVAVAIAEGHNGNASLAPSMLLVVGLHLLAAGLVPGVALHSLIQHVGVVEFHLLLPRSNGSLAVEQVLLTNLLRSLAYQAGDVLDDCLGHKHALRVSERSDSSVRRHVQLHAIDLQVEVVSPLVHGRHGLGEFQEEEAREVVSVACVAPGLDDARLDGAIVLVGNLVLDLEVVSATNADVLHLGVVGDLDSLLDLVSSHGSGASHRDVSAQLHAEATTGTSALDGDQGALAVQAQDAGQLRAAEVRCLGGRPDGHASTLLRDGAGSLLLHREAVLADHPGGACDAVGSLLHGSLDLVLLTDLAVCVWESAILGDGVINGQDGADIAARDIDLDQGCGLLGLSVGGGNDQANLLTWGLNLHALGQEKRLLTRGEAGVVEAWNVMGSDHSLDSISALGVADIDPGDLSSGTSGDNGVAIEGRHGHVVGVLHSASGEAGGRELRAALVARAVLVLQSGALEWEGLHQAQLAVAPGLDAKSSLRLLEELEDVGVGQVLSVLVLALGVVHRLVLGLGGKLVVEVRVNTLDHLLQGFIVKVVANKGFFRRLGSLGALSVDANGHSCLGDLLGGRVDLDAEGGVHEGMGQPLSEGDTVVAEDTGGLQREGQLGEQGVGGDVALLEVFDVDGLLVVGVVGDEGDLGVDSQQARDQIRGETSSGDHQVTSPAGLRTDMTLGQRRDARSEFVRVGEFVSALLHGSADVVDAHASTEDEVVVALLDEVELVDVAEVDERRSLAAEGLVGSLTHTLRGVTQHERRALELGAEGDDFGEGGGGIPGHVTGGEDLGDRTPGGLPLLHLLVVSIERLVLVGQRLALGRGVLGEGLGDIDQVSVASASADISVVGIHALLGSGLALLLQERVGVHHHAWSAETALHTEVASDSLLDRVAALPLSADALDGGDHHAVARGKGLEARVHSLGDPGSEAPVVALHDHQAGTTATLQAAALSARELGNIADVLQQGHPGVRARDLDRFAIQGDVQDVIDGRVHHARSLGILDGAGGTLEARSVSHDSSVRLQTAWAVKA
mmetsp:Transcript_70086/g.146572  ORF Transcript_70086/g.146572 Transcript_70086/m.146572 type:complete len:1042 (+) Transcript_70086:1253-4378(+)